MFPTQLPAPRRAAATSLPVLRWGIVGPGWIADHFARALREQTQQHIAAVCSRSSEKAQAFAARWSIPHCFTDLAQMLAHPEVDVVYIATPHNHHFPDAMQVLKAGKPVLVEKPLALNAHQAQLLQQEAARQQCLCLEAMWCDYAPKYDVIRQLLADGVLGELHTIIADHGEFFTPDHRIFNPTLAGGPMLDLGSYLLSFCVFAAGAPETIFAQGQPANAQINGQASMLLTHAQGVHSVLNTTLFSNTPGTALIAGRDATLLLEGQFYAPGNFTLSASQGGKTLHWEEPANRYSQLSHQAEHVAWCIGQGLTDSPVRPLAMSIATLAAMDEVRRQLGIVFNEERPT